MLSPQITLTSFDDAAQPQRRRLAPRLVLYILLFSGFVTLFATGLQVYVDYRRDVSDIDVRLTQIEHSYLNSIALSLWTMDYDHLKIQLEGIQALPDMQYLEVKSEGETLLTVGHPAKGRLLTRTFPLTFHYRGDDLTLGTLRVAANLHEVYRRLLDRVLVIFVSQGVKTFLVAGFILMLVQWMITRHLQHISHHVREMRPVKPSEPLALHRPPSPPGLPDELDDVVNAINTMRQQLDASYRRLADNEERFDLAMRGANDGVWDWSLDNDSVYYSPRCSEILGFTPEQQGDAADAWQHRLHSEDRELFRQRLLAHLRGITQQFECVFRVLDGEQRVRWVWSRGQALRGSDGRVSRVVGTHTDITRQKENEAALAVATRELQEEQERRAEAQRLACIGELSASIAHEIRNPLASIVNSLELLGMDDLPEEERHAVAEIVNKETRLLQRILNDFLNFARLSEPRLESQDVIETLRETVASLGLALEQSDRIEIQFLPHASSCIAVHDRDQIRQVVWNLALNSIQAMPQGGHIRLATNLCDEGVCVTVADDGNGIAADLIDKVTMPFVTDREEGTGLGLAIVKRILEQHNSQMQLTSREGEGTEVRFTLHRGE